MTPLRATVLALACAADLQAAMADEPAALQGLLDQGQRLEAQADADGQPADRAWEAASVYCEASRLGSTEAQYRLGMMYAFGRGVPASQPLGAALFSLAGMQGHEAAAQMLETIQMESAQLPACVLQAVAPERPPPVAIAPPPPEPQPIDRLVQSLPGDKQWIVPLATTLSEWYALDPRLVLAIIAVESNFDASARSPKDAMGLMQLIPDTAARFNVRDAFNATQNLRGGMTYLRWLLSYYEGNVTCVLAAYNAGEGRVDRYRGVPPYPETRAYVQRVIGLYGRVRHAFDAGVAARSDKPAPVVPVRC